ncbi:MAG: PAS domain-containing sensor histidine kinase [Lawsonibacter sp.]|nr:PAS domain-containing sensor histidine kinase [Lawsonibacter sp.]
MTKKIFRGSLLTSAVILAVSFAIVLTCLYNYFSALQEKQLRLELDLAVRGMETAGAVWLEGPAPQDLRITWVEADGAVRYDSQAPAEGLPNHRDRAEIRQALETGTGYSARFSDTLTKKTINCAARLSDGTVLRVSAQRLTALALTIAMLQPICILALTAIILSAVLASRTAVLAGDVTGREAERSRREFSANVSHELKTPLQSILGSAELLENGLVPADDVPHFAGRIRAESSRLVALIEDIIRLSQLDEAVPIPREPVELREVAEDVAASLQDSAAAKGVSLTVTGEAAELQGVPGLVREMVFNLCDNAIKYNVPGGTVEVSVARREGGALLTVRDTGIGIPPKYQGRVFERFFRVDKSRSKASGGTGLGLSIVKHGAQYHGAKISLRSQPDRGTEISVLFPAKS